MIDIGFHEFAMNKMRHIRSHLTNGPDDTAWTMTKGTFQNHKQEFGREDSDRQDRKGIQVRGLAMDFTSEAASIRRGKFLYTK
jgi:hypothetical protein